jgi:hypothetical protein
MYEKIPMTYLKNPSYATDSESPSRAGRGGYVEHWNPLDLLVHAAERASILAPRVLIQEGAQSSSLFSISSLPFSAFEKLTIFILENYVTTDHQIRSLLSHQQFRREKMLKTRLTS